jgi:anti-sigma regulatory factor (Ser/Thr protein kinase)
MKFTALIPGQQPFRDVAGSMLRAVCQCLETTRRMTGLEWRVVTAFNEAFNNIVKHGYAGTDGDIEVQVDVEDERLVVRMTDDGPAFDFDASGTHDEPPPFDQLDEGGMGLYLIRKAVTEVRYAREHDRNLLTFIQHFSDCSRIESSLELK